MALVATFRPKRDPQWLQSVCARLIETLLIEARLLEQGKAVRMADLPSEWVKAAPVLEDGATAQDREAARRWATELVEAFIGRDV